MTANNISTAGLNTYYKNGEGMVWKSLLQDKKFFKKYINKILEASKEETLFKGYIGHSAEISSASTLCSQGCWAQAWSAATLIEALKLITY